MNDLKKVKEFLQNILLKSTPAFVTKEKDDRKNINDENVILGSIYSEYNLIAKMVEFCEQKEDFVYAKALSSKNPREKRFSGINHLHVKLIKKINSEYDMYFTRIMLRTLKDLIIFNVSVQQKEDFYEIKVVQENDFCINQLKYVKPEELNIRSFQELRKKIRENIYRNNIKIYHMSMFTLQDITQVEAMKLIR